MAFKDVLVKANIPTAVAYEDETNTFTSAQTFNSPLQMGSSSTPSANGQIGYNGTEILFREGGTNRKIASTDTASSYSALQTYTSGIQINSFTPTVNGQLGYNGTNLLFREGGVNKTIGGSGSSAVYTMQAYVSHTGSGNGATQTFGTSSGIATLPEGKTRYGYFNGAVATGTNGGNIFFTIGAATLSFSAANNVAGYLWELEWRATRFVDVDDGFGGFEPFIEVAMNGKLSRATGTISFGAFTTAENVLLSSGVYRVATNASVADVTLLIGMQNSGASITHTHMYLVDY